jgi:GT2 family glycosyltransferase
MDQPRPALTAVIVTFRNGMTLPAALAALRQAAPADTELVVVENGGDASVAATVEAAWPGAIVIVSERNGGFAAGVNQGVARARGAAVLLLNPDAEVEPGAIGALQAALETIPDAGIVAARLLTLTGDPVLSCYPFFSLASVAWRHFQVYRLLPNVVLGQYRQATLDPARIEPVPVGWAQGACWLVRRALLDKLGGFDEAFFLYAEEVDFAFRAARAGWRSYLVPTAQVRHAEGSSTGQVVPLKLASHYFCKVVYFAKHRGPAQTVLLRSLLLLDLSLRMVYRSVGVARGHPSDARQRLATYARIAGALLMMPAPRLIEHWRTLGQSVVAAPTLTSVTRRRERPKRVPMTSALLHAGDRIGR